LRLCRDADCMTDQQGENHAAEHYPLSILPRIA
jgi:hypothetical protein